MFGRLLDWYTIYTFLGALAPNKILPDTKFTLCTSLAFSYIDSATARQTYEAWYKEWNYGTFAPRHFRSREQKPLTEFCQLAGWLEFNVPFQHKYGYIRDEILPAGKFTAYGKTKTNVFDYV